MNIVILKLLATCLLTMLMLGVALEATEVKHPWAAQKFRTMLTSVCVVTLAILLYWVWVTVPARWW